MIVSCVYCQREIKATDTSGPVSHGVCHLCLPTALDDLQIPLEDYLEVVPFPAMLVDERGSLVHVNQHYLSTLGNVSQISIDSPIQVESEEAQDAPEMPYKGTDTVKMVVCRSLEKDEDLKHENATAEITESSVKRRLNMVIGTMRVGNQVIVQVENVQDEP